MIPKPHRTFISHSLPLLLLILAALPTAQPIDVAGKVVEIEPVALDVILSIYDRTIVLFTNGIKADNTKMFEDAIKGVLGVSEPTKFNKTLFAICDIEKDHSGKLRKFGSVESIQLITGVTHYSLKYPENAEGLQKFFNTEFPQFLTLYTSSKVKTAAIEDLQSSPYNEGFLLYLTVSTEAQKERVEQIHSSIFDYLKFFNTSFILNPTLSPTPTLQLYHNGSPHTLYAQSALQALLNFTAEPSRNEINELVDFVNIQTIDNVTFLEDENYFRVFGGSIQYQMLLVYREGQRESEELRGVIEEYEKAAVRNRNEGLKYERVLFAAATQEFLRDYFADEILQDQNKLYQILITKTDYSSFQLRKYIYEPTEVTADKLLTFIEEVRMKKIDPQYKSEEVEDNTGRKIRKIVGNSFINQVFEQPQRSVMVLFVDSKDPGSSASLREAFQGFVEKYHGAYQEYMNVGVFDLAKNEHKALTISSAPQLIMFERSNKKKAKFFKGSTTPDSIKSWVNYEAKDFTIPENYGQPPIALGPTGSQL